MNLQEEQIVELLASKFEPELAKEMASYSVVRFPGNVVVGNEGDNVEFISIVLSGSIRVVQPHRKADEIEIYNIDSMQSCIISLTNAVRNQRSKVRGITNGDTSLLLFPKTKNEEWAAKYPSWRSFTFDLFDRRLSELLGNLETVKEQKENILESIHYAKRIQGATLPSMEIAENLLPEHFILFKPRDIVSGDYYWLTQIEGKTIVVVADCTGHGVPGAFMSMLGISILNQLVNNHNLLHANEILELMRDNVKKSLRQDDHDSESKDGMDMALIIFDFENKKLEFAGANNPLYIIRNNELIKLDADKMPIGVYVVDDRKFNLHEMDIQEGDCYYTFSDGFVDQVGGESNRKFMRKNFTELLLKIHESPMAEQKVLLDETIENWKGKNEQVDDILVFGIRV